jgi:ketosteroid isomerase-like protein
VKIWHKNTAAAALVALTIMTVSGCAASPTAESPQTSASASAAPESSASPEESQPPQTGATEAFLAWVEASRIADVDTACAGLAPDLVTRMIAELNASGATGVQTCEQMIAATAELYRAVGDDGTVDVAVQDETATDATLFVTYTASGDCGTVVMHRTGTDWIITDESQECVG